MDIKKLSEELPKEIKDKAIDIYCNQQKIYNICDILQREVEPENDVDLLYFLHSAIKMMPKPYRDKLFYEASLLLKARREELYSRLRYLKAEYENQEI